MLKEYKYMIFCEGFYMCISISMLSGMFVYTVSWNILKRGDLLLIGN